MTKPWNPRLIVGNQRPALPRRSSSWRPKPAEIGLVLVGGLALGLAAVPFLPTPSSRIAQTPELTTRVDPYSQARRSRAILEAQESAPAPALPFQGGGTRAQGRALVIDGDTFRIGDERIRIADIDTPEMDGRCAYEQRLARRARARLTELLGESDFELHRIGERDRDRYGRSLRIVVRNGRSIGDQMVAEGLARTWTGRRLPWC